MSREPAGATDAARPFPDAEYDRRIDAVRRVMGEHGIAALLVGDPANMTYLTGYDGWTFYTPQLVLLEASGGDPTWFGRAMDASLAASTTGLGAEHVIAYPDGLVDNVEHHPLEHLADLLRDRELASERIGLEMDTAYVTPRWRDVLTSVLPAASIVNAGGLVNGVRSVKSDLEIELMRQAARIAEHAMRTAVEVTRSGIRESEAVAEIVRAQLRGIDGRGGDYPSSWPHYLVGEKAGMPHAPWSDQPLASRQAVAVELGGCRHRYHAALARTVVIGRPEPRLVDLAHAVEAAMDATLTSIRPGVAAEDVEAAWRAAMADTGYTKSSRIGYSLGVGYPPSWIEHSISLRPGERTVLEPNMCFHLILGMWEHGWGYELSETVRVTPDGSECLTSFPRRLFEGGERLEAGAS
jgi:ectoine hydrolase